MKPINMLLVLLVLICAGGWLFSARSASAAERALEKLGDEKAQTELELRGYQTAYARTVDGFLAADSASKALQIALEDAQSRRVARTEVRTVSTIDTVFVADTTASDSSISATVAADPIYGTVSYQPPARTFGLNLRCEVRLEQYLVQSAGDSLLIGVQALSPRTVAYVDAFDVTPYLRKEPGTSLWSKVKYVLGGAALGATIWEFAR